MALLIVVLLLGVVEWGRGNGAQAWVRLKMDHGLMTDASWDREQKWVDPLMQLIPVSCFMGLHKEATYDQSNPTTEQTIESEIAR